MKLKLVINFEKDQYFPYDYSNIQTLGYQILSPNLSEKAHGHNPGLFVCSNIFDTKNKTIFKGLYQNGVDYNFVISSFDGNYGTQNIIFDMFQNSLVKRNLNFGENKIFIKKSYIENSDKIYSGKILKTITPIVLSLDKDLCEKYNIESKFETTYWRKDMGFEVFAKQLDKNIYKKYLFLLKSGIVKTSSFDEKLLELYNYENIDDFEKFVSENSLFSGYKFVKEQAIKYKTSTLIGSNWNLVVQNSPLAKKVTENVLQIGIGERCTAGLGYMK